jgi:DNA end-binding protein Ku
MAQKEKYSGPRALWKGTINFGLVSIPVRLVSAVRDVKIHFHRVTPDGKCRLRQKLVCPETGKEYNFGDAARGYEIAPNQFVIVDDEEVERIEPQSGHGIDIIQFVNLTEIDPIYYDRPYYFIPDGKTHKPYQLLRQVMQEHGKVALAQMVMHDKQYIVIIRDNNGILLAQTLRYAAEIISPRKVLTEEDVHVTPKEVDLAADLIESLTKPFRPEEFVDDFTERMEKLLEQKGKGKAIKIPKSEPVPEPTKVVDLMSRLKQSLEKAQRSTKRSPSKKRAGKKAA